MAIAHTQYGRTVLTKIRQLGFLAITVTDDNRAFNERIAEQDERRASETLERIRADYRETHSGQELDISSVKISFEGRAAGNDEYTQVLEQFTNESLVCRSIDLYHWYLRQVIKLAITRQPSLAQEWAQVLQLSSKKAAELEDAATKNGTLASLFPRRENVFRRLIHQHLGIPDLGVLSLLVEVRNCLVHHLGEDIDGAAAVLAAECPEIGIEVTDGFIAISNSAALETMDRVLSDISIIDQAVANVLGLPTTTEPLREIRRTYN